MFKDLLTDKQIFSVYEWWRSFKFICPSCPEGHTTTWQWLEGGLQHWRCRHRKTVSPLYKQAPPTRPTSSLKVITSAKCSAPSTSNKVKLITIQHAKMNKQMDVASVTSHIDEFWSSAWGRPPDHHLGSTWLQLWLSQLANPQKKMDKEVVCMLVCGKHTLINVHSYNGFIFKSSGAAEYLQFFSFSINEISFKCIILGFQRWISQTLEHRDDSEQSVSRSWLTAQKQHCSFLHYRSTAGDNDDDQTNERNVSHVPQFAWMQPWMLPRGARLKLQVI